jgi:glycosyltransferase involved in cell wall biosynthesis
VRRAIVRFALSAADQVTAGSKYQCDLAVKQGLDPGKVRQIPLGVDLDRFLPGPTVDWQQPTLLQAASLTPVKNQALLLSVLEQVRTQIPAIRLILAGDGPLAASLRQAAKGHGLAETITWQADRPHPRMADFYHQGHVYVQSSLHESQGVAVLEALACGLPVMGTPVGLMVELAAQRTSWSPHVLADQIISILSDRSGYEALRRRTRRLAEERFDLDQTVARFTEMYHDLLGR